MNDPDRALYEHLDRGLINAEHDPDDDHCNCRECQDRYEDMADRYEPEPLREGE